MVPLQKTRLCTPRSVRASHSFLAQRLRHGVHQLGKLLLDLRFLPPCLQKSVKGLRCIARVQNGLQLHIISRSHRLYALKCMDVTADDRPSLAYGNHLILCSYFRIQNDICLYQSARIHCRVFDKLRKNISSCRNLATALNAARKHHITAGKQRCCTRSTVNLNVSPGTDDDAALHIAIDNNVTEKFNFTDNRIHIAHDFMHVLNVYLAVLNLDLTVALRIVNTVFPGDALSSHRRQIPHRISLHLPADNRIAVHPLLRIVIDRYLIAFMHVLEGAHTGIIHRAVLLYLRADMFFRREKILEIPIRSGFLLRSFRHQNFSVIHLFFHHGRQIGAVIPFDHTV